MEDREIPKAREQAELMIVRAMAAVIPKTMDALLMERPRQQQVTREAVLALVSRLETCVDDHDLRLFVLERTTPLEASLVRQSCGFAVNLVRTYAVESEAYRGVVGRLLRGDPLVELVRLGLIAMAGPG